MPEQYQCPLCPATFGSKGSVKAHITRKADEQHKGESGPDYGSEIQAVDSDETSDEESGGESGNSGGVVPSEYQQEQSSGDDGADCCSNPSLKGNSGEIWEIDGNHYRLEESDRVCDNCDTLIEG